MDPVDDNEKAVEDEVDIDSSDNVKSINVHTDGIFSSLSRDAFSTCITVPIMTDHDDMSADTGGSAV